MQRMMLGVAALCAVGYVSAGTPSVSPSSETAHGRRLYISKGCYECHGYSGEGTVGPRLAPDPLPIEAFTQQLRDPINRMPIRMPVYTSKVLSEADIADIYRFLSSVPKPEPVERIPLLR